MSFHPTLWGSLMWTMLHFITMSYPIDPDDTTIMKYGIWFEHLADILPCRSCGENLRLNMKRLQYDRATHLHTRDTFVRFVCDLHNCVNRELFRSEVRFEDVYAFYEYVRSDPLIQCEVSFYK